MAVAATVTIMAKNLTTTVARPKLPHNSFRCSENGIKIPISHTYLYIQVNTCITIHTSILVRSHMRFMISLFVCQPFQSATHFFLFSSFFLSLLSPFCISRTYAHFRVSLPSGHFAAEAALPPALRTTCPPVTTTGVCRASPHYCFS
ncbi:unnamed protein product [Ceratitis capitata]|uniref:(Mediterranean fruit fly) hypothetical protein n=1 Tax=Ceratitis capitata TaxID=7213 RepID=A0A811UMR2_CERCA|nr:unnamed protein product [Ceratitis capitata]